MDQRRVGIFAGTFDPVHAGHIGFALQALRAGRLDMVYFVPERRPRRKSSVTHYAHRLAMLKQALKPYPRLRILELPDRQFTVHNSLPRLRQQLPNANLALLIGSDVAMSLKDWPHIEQLLDSCELVIAARGTDQKLAILNLLEQLPIFPLAVTLIGSAAPDMSSSFMRSALRRNLHTHGLLSSVRRYARSEWLYASVSSE